MWATHRTAIPIVATGIFLISQGKPRKKKKERVREGAQTFWSSRTYKTAREVSELKSPTGRAEISLLERLLLKSTLYIKAIITLRLESAERVRLFL